MLHTPGEPGPGWPLPSVAASASLCEPDQRPGDHTSDGRRWKRSDGLQSQAVSAWVHPRRGYDNTSMPEAPVCQFRLTGRHRRNVNWMHCSMQSMRRPQRDALVADFEQVEHLCDPVGQKALQSVVATDARILALLPLGKATRHEASHCCWKIPHFSSTRLRQLTQNVSDTVVLGVLSA